MNKAWGGFLSVTGFLACPCHLPFSLPLALGVLGGTGVGGLIAANTGLIYGVATAYFIVGLGAGVYLWNRKQRARGSEACAVPTARRIEET